MRDLTRADNVDKNFDEGRAIFVMNANGGNQQRITFRSDYAAYDVNADWQPLLAPSIVPPSSVLGFSAATYQAFEDSGSIPIIVTRAGNLNESASCFYATEDGTATIKKNYAPALGTLHFAVGEASKIKRGASIISLHPTNHFALVKRNSNLQNLCLCATRVLHITYAVVRRFHIRELLFDN